MAEELTQALEALAQRGEPRGPRAVLDSARRDAAHEPAPWWVTQPAWVAIAAFVSTLTVLGGSLAIGLAVQRPARDVGAGWISQSLDEVATTSTTEWLLIPIVAAIIAIAALIVRKHQLETRKERTMATTIDKAPIDDLKTEQLKTLETTRRNNHWLVATVVLLALALVAMGAWTIYDGTSEPVTAATSEVQSLYDDYLTAWTNADSEAFLDTTTEDFTQTSFGITMSRSDRAGIIRVSTGATVELVGELVVMADGASYYVGAAEKVTFGGSEYEGVSAYRMVETADGLKISEHSWVGNL